MNNLAIPSRLEPISVNTQSGIGTISTITPISYDFQVVEFCDKTGKVIKSRLEVQRNIHDIYGNISYSEGWQEVPRIQRPI